MPPTSTNEANLEDDQSSSSPDAEEATDAVKGVDLDKNSSERAEAATLLASPEEAAVPLDFEAEDLPRYLAQASEDDLNKADFGVVQLDDDGRIQFYNEYEQRLSGIPHQEAVGESFFEEIAPCTYSDRFSGKFFEGVEAGDLNELFTYTFTYRMEPLLVKIRLCRDTDGRNYVLIDPMR